MTLLDSLKQNSLIENSKGGLYHQSTWDDNLNLYAGISRFEDEDIIISSFDNAYNENRELALANLLYILDIREGKGERRIFRILFKHLCRIYKNDATIILNYIGELGRYDYILEALNTPVESKLIRLIDNQLSKDLQSETPSLLAKWLPSHRTHKKDSYAAKRIMHLLGMSECNYRKILAELRKKINIVEKNLTEKAYDQINFEHVPTKAMLKYTNAFNKNMSESFKQYKDSLVHGEVKINTEGLFCHDIISKIKSNCFDVDIVNSMWKNQKNIDMGDANVLVVADTSGSMSCYNSLPLSASIGLALYTSERNKGVLKNHFITFSSTPVLQQIKGKDIVSKVRNIKMINDNTDIDKVFKLILDTMIDNNLKQDELPSHIIIISDMEFDEGVYSKGGTNFSGWKKAFEKEGFKLPKIVFWNVAGSTRGYPVTKYDNDCIMVSGFSTNLLENIFNVEKFNPVDQMMETLKKYINLIK